MSEDCKVLLRKPVKFEFAGLMGEGDLTHFTWGRGGKEPITNMAYSMRYALEAEREKALGINGKVRFFHNDRYQDAWTAAIILGNNRNHTFKARLLGFNEHAQTKEQLSNTGPHLGRRVWLSDLPLFAQEIVLEELLQLRGNR